MKHKIIKTVSLVVMIAALACAILCPVCYSRIGSYVAANGILVEPFYLIPMAYCFLLLALISAAVFVIARKKYQNYLTRQGVE